MTPVVIVSSASTGARSVIGTNLSRCGARAECRLVRMKWVA
ncbi:hypothetical protein [Azospirillum doebereinerae]